MSFLKWLSKWKAHGEQYGDGGRTTMVIVTALAKRFTATLSLTFVTMMAQPSFLVSGLFFA